MKRATLAIGAIACLLISCGDERRENASPGARIAPERSVTDTDAQPSPARRTTASIAVARGAADAGRYRRAIAVARRLGPASEREIRERIANRVARGALAAVRGQSLGDARALLRQADRYPSTNLTRESRIAYADAQARAAQRARDLQAQVQQRIRRQGLEARRARAQRAMERSSGL